MVMFHPKHVWLNNMNFKNIVWFIKAISYFVLLRSFGLIIMMMMMIIIIIIYERSKIKALWAHSGSLDAVSL